MKKKKFLRNASLVALSAVMMCGTAAAFAGCGGAQSEWLITVKIFCSDSDATTNEAVCKAWAQQYDAENRERLGVPEGEKIDVEFNHLNNQETYFSTLIRELPTGNAADVIYVSPKYVKAWAQSGRVLDLSEYIEPTEENAKIMGDIWEDSLGFYAYAPTVEDYTSGQRVTYTTSGANGAGYYTADGTKTGVYGLPKDYSNFGLGFNNKFFSDAVRKAITSTNATARRNVQGAQYDTANLTFKGTDDADVVTDPDTGRDCPIIRIGKPTTYKPYNFYKYASYEEAESKGDPMVHAMLEYTGGAGYTVTIPGFPGDSFEITDEKDKNPDAEYDQSKGYITYTYAEYAAMTWAITYYVNTFDWDNSDPLNGTGGCPNIAGTQCNVYGNDQYDGVLYLLPWLAGNDANYVDTTSQYVWNRGAQDKDGKTYTSRTDAANKVTSKAGTDSEKVPHLNLQGEMENRDIQYGANSENFVETYGAFLSYGSDWNGNSNNTGDTTASKQSGWDMFVAGNVVFYGVGTWNMNPLNATDRSLLEYKLMPEPVGEKYALYSSVKDANYQGLRGYGVLKDYSGNVAGSGLNEEGVQNQIERQDKWGARMDSVGFGVNADVLKVGEWKAAAAASLVQTLSADAQAQLDLTYAGAQLPNFKSQCVDFLHYQDEGYENGAFKDMITPDGNAAGEDVWDEAYALAKEMRDLSLKGDTRPIGDYLADKTIGGKPVNYDERHKDDTLASLNKNSTPLATAMSYLYMVSYTRADRDICLRMQAGLNAVRDSSMYTFESTWLGKLEGRSTTYLMAYKSQTALTAEDQANGINMVFSKDAGSKTPSGYATPEYFLFIGAGQAQAELNTSITKEANQMSGRS